MRQQSASPSFDPLQGVDHASLAIEALKKATGRRRPSSRYGSKAKMGS
jgi:hypothetical protein